MHPSTYTCTVLPTPRSQRAPGVWLQRCTTAGRPQRRGSGREAPAEGLLLGRKQVKLVPFWCWCLNISSWSIHCRSFSATAGRKPPAWYPSLGWEGRCRMRAEPRVPVLLLVAGWQQCYHHCSLLPFLLLQHCSSPGARAINWKRL